MITCNLLRRGQFSNFYCKTCSREDLGNLKVPLEMYVRCKVFIKYGFAFLKLSKVDFYGDLLQVNWTHLGTHYKDPILPPYLSYGTFSHLLPSKRSLFSSCAK